MSDPADPRNHVLRLASPAHTDATVIRPSQPLPPKYRVSLRIGFIDFGDGKSGGLNGYKGGETPQPWLSGDATQQNGVYWLTILDAQPRPHNNVWIHHHRKVVMDTDNNVPPWMESFDGSAFHLDGQHPVMMFALDGTADPHELWGPPFLSWPGPWPPSSTPTTSTRSRGSPPAPPTDGRAATTRRACWRERSPITSDARAEVCSFVSPGRPRRG